VAHATKTGKVIAVAGSANKKAPNTKEHEMNTKKLLNKVAVSISAATLALALGACAHHSATAGQDYGQVRPEASATQSTSSDQVIGQAPAPSNSPNTTVASGPAVIPGPAKVDNSGNAYTSSSVGSAGNGSATGLNTNVNIVPKSASSSVTVTQSPSVAESTTETTTTTVTNEPTPAPTVAEVTPAPVPEAPMASSTTQETTTTTTTTPTETTHRRLRKD
jgi:hypothetical protein